MDFLKQYFPFLALIGSIGVFWTQIKAVVHKIFNLFIVELDIRKEACDAISTLLRHKGKVLSFGKFTFEGKDDYCIPVLRRITVIYKLFNREPQFIWYQKNIILLNELSGKDTDGSEEWYRKRVKLYFFRGTFNPTELMKDAENFYNDVTKKSNSRFFIKRIFGKSKKNIQISAKESPENLPIPISETSSSFFSTPPINWKPEDINYGKNDKYPPKYVFSSEVQTLLNKLKKWKVSEKFYKERGLLWRHGTLIYGIPGSGKSSAVRNICYELDIPLFVFDLASLSNDELINHWNACQESVPCAVVFDDLDLVFNKRKNIVGEDGGGLSFDCFLNCIGGTLPAEGIMFFITTNKIELMDEALGIPNENGTSTRPGRVDVLIKLDKISREDRILLAKNILLGYDELIEEFVKAGDGMTAAQFSDLCSQEALKLYWQEKDKEINNNHQTKIKDKRRRSLVFFED